MGTGFRTCHLHSVFVGTHRRVWGRQWSSCGALKGPQLVLLVNKTRLVLRLLLRGCPWRGGDSGVTLVTLWCPLAEGHPRRAEGAVRGL